MDAVRASVGSAGHAFRRAISASAMTAYRPRVEDLICQSRLTAAWGGKKIATPGMKTLGISSLDHYIAVSSEGRETPLRHRGGGFGAASAIGYRGAPVAMKARFADLGGQDFRGR